MALNSKVIDHSGLTIRALDLELTGDQTISDDLTVTGTLTVAGGVVGNVVNSGQTKVAAGGTLTLTAAHSGNVIQLDTAAGSVVTLPAATGTGNIYEFVTTVIATSNSHIVKVANATDVFSGALASVDNADGTVTVFGCTGATTTRSDTITLNRTTTGSVHIGERFCIKDVKTGHFSVWGCVTATGSEATPFSATV